MAIVKKVIGKVPIGRGNYSSTTAYYAENTVTMYGMSFRALTNISTGVAPAVAGATGKVTLINTDKWQLMSGTPEGWNITAEIRDLQKKDKEIMDNLDALVVNDLTTGGADKALSAEMGKELGENTNIVLLKGQGTTGVKSILYNLLPEHTYRIHLHKKWEEPSDLSADKAYFELYYKDNNNNFVILSYVSKGGELDDFYDISLPANLNDSNLYIYIRAEVGEVLRFIIEDITARKEKVALQMIGKGAAGVFQRVYVMKGHSYRVSIPVKWNIPSDIPDNYAFFELYYKNKAGEFVILSKLQKNDSAPMYSDVLIGEDIDDTSELYIYIRAIKGESVVLSIEDITYLTEAYNLITNNSARISLTPSVGYHIFTNEGVGNKSQLLEHQTSTWQSVVEECNEGDEYLITGKGGNSPRLWCFLDSNDIILKVSQESASAIDLRIKAPALAKKLIINTKLDSYNSCYKIISIDEVVKASIDNKKELAPTSVGTQIVTAATIGDTPSFQIYSKEVAQIFDIECSPNDRFVVTGKGFTNARLWAFFDSEDKVLSISDANITETQRVITAPNNAVRLIINSSVGEKSYALKKTIKIEELDNRIDDLNERVSLGDGIITNMLPMCQFVSLEADAANGMENWTGQEVIEKIYEPLREAYPQYIKRKSIGKSGGFDIWLYEFNNTVEEWFRLDDYVRVSNAILPSTNGLTSKQVGIPKDVFLSSFSMDYLNLYPLSVFSVRKPTLANVELSYIGGEEYYILSCEDDIKVSDNAVDIYWTTRVKTYDQHAMIVSGTHADENAGYLGVALALKYMVEHHSDNAIMDYIYNNVKLSVVPIFNMWGANQTPKDRNAQDGTLMNRWTVGSLNAEQQILSDYVGSIKDELSYYIDCHTAEWWSNYGYVFAIPYPHAKMIPAIVSTANYLCRHWFPKELALNWNIGKSSSGMASQSYMAETYGIDAATVEFCGQDLIEFTGCKRWDSKYMTMAVENFLNYILSITSMRIKYNSKYLIDEPLFTRGVMT